MNIGNLLKDDKGENFEFVGITIGVVTNIDDPDGLGRVKVRLLNRDDSNTETKFIRVVTWMSGQEWGAYFLPEVGDEVIVGFCGGDMSQPYVLGSLWNKNKKVPQQIKDGKNNIKMIKTKTGHSIIFNDEENKGSIEIISAKGLNIKIQDEKSIISIGDKDDKNLVKIDAEKGEISITAEKKLTLSGGESTITLDKNIKMESSNGKISLDGQELEAKAKGGFSAQGATTKIKANGQLNVEASGIANIKGAMVKIN